MTLGKKKSNSNHSNNELPGFLRILQQDVPNKPDPSCLAAKTVRLDTWGAALTILTSLKQWLACIRQLTSWKWSWQTKISDPDVFWTSERTENCKQRQWCNVHNVAFAGIQRIHDDSTICAKHTVHKHIVSFSELLSTKSDSLAAHFLCGNPAANNNFKSSTKPPDRGMEASWGSRFEAATSPLTPWQELPPTWKWIMGTPLFFPWDASLNLRGTNWLMWVHLLQLVM